MNKNRISVIVVTIDYHYTEEIKCVNGVIKPGDKATQRYLCRNIKSVGEAISSFCSLYHSEIDNVTTEYIVIDKDSDVTPF